MVSILILACIICFITTVFILIHLRPLDKDEIAKLSFKRRNKRVNSYFFFSKEKFNVSQEFKKAMDPKGKFYSIKEDSFSFPSTAAALLKYKKHEWVIIAFEENQQINLLWLNKGQDRASVSFYLSIEQIISTAKQGGHKSIFIFHNHPNSNPNYIITRIPSKKDIDTAQEFANIFRQEGLNLLEFVCERGKHYKYFQSITDSFYPSIEFIEVINRENNLSKSKNLSLHLERIFK